MPPALPFGHPHLCASSRGPRLSPPPPQGASGFFSLVGANRPELRLDRSLDFDRWPNMTFQLLVRVSRPLPPSSREPTAPPEPLQPQAPGPDGRAALLQDTREENVEPSHTAMATLVLEVQPADLRPPWFLPCTYSDGFVCIHAQYHSAVPTGHTLVQGARRNRAA